MVELKPLEASDIENSIAEGEAYRIVVDGKNAGGLVLRVEGTKCDLDLLFVSPKAHTGLILIFG